QGRPGGWQHRRVRSVEQHPRHAAGHIGVFAWRHAPDVSPTLRRRERHAGVGFLRCWSPITGRLQTLRRHDDNSARLKRRGLAITGLVVTCAVVLSGCDESTRRGFLPHGVTDQSGLITTLWNGSWIAALGVGVLVWGLIFWCVVAYRRKKDDVGLPEQLRYNVPIEILYTVVPLFLITALFYSTARDESALLDISKKPDVTVNVIGKQWSWDFNYVEAGTFQAGT